MDHRDGPQGRAELAFQWPEPVGVKEVLYYGPTVHNLRRCWKDYELFADGGSRPVVKGRFGMRHGAQRIVLPRKVRCGKLRFRFLNHYGGRNPGAAEVMIFPAELSAEQLLKLKMGDYFEIERSAASRRLRADLLGERLGFTQILVVKRNRIDPSHVYTYHQEGHRPGGGLYLAKPTPTGCEWKLLVDASQGQIIDCNLSYDARRVLFSWRRTMKDKVQVYVVNIDGTGLRRITRHDSRNVNPCWLPDGGIAFLSDRKPAYAYCWITTSPVLYRCDADGGNVVRLSANYLNDFTPAVRDDGRIVYSRWEYVDRPAIPIQGLWTIGPDGTNLAGLFGNRVLSPATFMEARQVPGTSKILCVLTAHNGPCRGAVGLVDPAKGSNVQEAIENLTPEVGIGAVDQGHGNDVRGPYESPVPVDARHFLVSRGGTILLRDYRRTCQIRLLAGEKTLGYYNAQPVMPRPRPPIRRSWIDPGASAWATLLLHDIYRGLEPHVKRGEVKRIAVVQEIEKSRHASLDRLAFGFQFPVVSCGATYAPKRVWGFAAVEENGSAHFMVPAGKPIYFLAIDAQGRAVQRMRSFTHLMPGERQSCTGCHANRSIAAPNHRRRPLAARRPAQALVEPDWVVRGFSYAHVVQPVWDQHCVRCHNPRKCSGGIDLTGDKTDFFNVSYEHLARKGYPGRSRFTKWIPTYNGMERNILEVTPKHWGSPASLLAKHILGGHPGKDGRPRIKLDAVLKDVASRRCVRCHKDAKDRRDGWVHADGRIHRKVWMRITHPELNNFLLAPLAKSAGGTKACGQAVFRSTDDADYRAILKTFDPVTRLMKDTPPPPRPPGAREGKPPPRPPPISSTDEWRSGSRLAFRGGRR